MNEQKLIRLDERLIEQDKQIYKYYSSNDEALNELKDGLKKGTYFSGFCTKCDKDGNLYVDINGITCIMEKNEVSIPINDSSEIHKGLCQKKVGSFINAKVIKIDSKNPNDPKIYISRKHMIKEIRNYYNNQLTLGSIVEGKVFNIDEKQGVFVDIGGDYIGIIPRNYLENLFVTDLSSHVSIGETVQAVVMNIKHNSKGDIIHLSLDRRSMLPSFDKLTETYGFGDIIVAKVKSIHQNGIYCSLDKHLDIICDFNNNRYKEGQNLRVKITSIRPDKKRISGVILGKV